MAEIGTAKYAFVSHVSVTTVLVKTMLGLLSSLTHLNQPVLAGADVNDFFFFIAGASDHLGQVRCPRSLLSYFEIMLAARFQMQHSPRGFDSKSYLAGLAPNPRQTA